MNRTSRIAILLLVLISGLIYAELKTVKPEPETEFVLNPDCGWYSANYEDTYEVCKRRTADGGEPFPHASAIYTRHVSSSWENEEGVFEGAPVKLLDNWISHGRRVSFRVWAQRHSDLPEWWKSKIKKLPADQCNEGNDLCFWDPPYVEHHRKIIEALGKKYNGNPHIAWVDIGAVGNSGGEWCIHGWEKYEKAGLTKKIYFELCKQIVEIYCKAFPDTQLIIAHDCLPTSGSFRGELEKFLKERNVGIRNDGLGMGPDKLCYSKDDFLAFYKLLPTIYENVVQWKDGDVNTRTCLDAALTAHPCFVRAGTSESTSEQVERNAPKILDEYGRKFGYHLRVKQARYQSPCYGKLNLELTWVNEGTSPAYAGHSLEIALLNRAGKVFASEIVQPKPAVPEWLPGKEIPIRVALKLPKGRSGKCQITVRLIHPRKDWSWPVKLEMKNHTPDWRYIIGEVEVKGRGPKAAPAKATPFDKAKKLAQYSSFEAAIQEAESVTGVEQAVIDEFIEGCKAGKKLKQLIIEKAGTTKQKLSIAFGGSPADVVKAEKAGVYVDMGGAQALLGWNRIKPAQFYSLAHALTEDEKLLALYCSCVGFIPPKEK